MDKFEKKVKPGGILLYDPNGIVHPPTRTDITVYRIEGTKIAADMGNVKTFNMVVLGAYLKARPVVQTESIRKGLEKSLPERHHKLIPMNLEAIEAGMEHLELVSKVTI
jgi:2-oxoglutarate ferredoxin oxidoreductase subunit gamma